MTNTEEIRLFLFILLMQMAEERKLIEREKVKEITGLTEDKLTQFNTLIDHVVIKIAKEIKEKSQ